MMKVFISHATQDRDIAVRLTSLLKARQFSTWSSALIIPGVDWKSAIADAVSEAQGYVFLIGSDSSDDRWQQFEWQAVLESIWDRSPERPMVSVLIGNMVAPVFLSDRVALRLEGTREGRFEGSLDLIADQLVPLLLNPEKTRLPVNYDQVREEQEQRLDLLKRFALSLKAAHQHPESPSLPR